MNAFDPGDGWREVTGTNDYQGNTHLIERNDIGNTVRIWVREEPVPPLPTAPHTVIRVTWHESEDDRLVDLLVRGDDQWSAVEADQWHTVRNLPDAITGFEVLSEPRAVTAKAVLDRVRSIGWRPIRLTDDIAREFGVTTTTGNH